MLLLALPALAQQTISIHEYLDKLEQLQRSLAAHQLQLAQTEAKQLSELVVSSPQGRFHADTSLLLAIAKANRADVQLQSRLAVTIAEIRRVTPGAHAAADPRLLARVASEQEVPELAPGGEIPLKPATLPLTERIARSLERVWSWILDKLKRLLEWILDFLPDSARRSGATGGMRWIVSALVAVIVLLIVILALESRRRARGRKKKTSLETSEPLGSKRDDDPLSRGANEWERYAAQLAQAGRFREAIRAWYHAALVSCYAAGVLHFRKSRTNWEYIAALAPSHAWRPEFISLTRRFEREWYGASQSSPDAYDDCHRRARAVIEGVRGAA